MSRKVIIPCSGYAINADWYDGANGDVMLMLHGFTSSRSRQALFTDFMVKETGMAAIVIDYSGHGDSPFELQDTRPAQHLLEVIAAYDWVKKNHPQANITVIGNSYGSFLAAHVLQYRPVHRLVLRAPAIYTPESFYDLWSVRFADEEAYRRSVTTYRKSREQMMRSPLLGKRELNIAIPTLVVIHELDETVPYETSRTYADALRADTYTAVGFRHSISDSDITKAQREAYHAKIANWLNAQ